MYALINMMSAVDPYVGRILSIHRTVAALEAADKKLQRSIRLNNGQSSYLPTIGRKLVRRVQVGSLAARSDVIAISDSDR
jgi:hypothetical protein